jgi:3-oxoacyl-[acyl-carrier-protein] synthase-3
MGIKILGTGSYTPEFCVNNEDMTKIVETSDEWITSRTGIKNRHISNGEPTWYMGLEAAKKALDAAGISPEQIGLIVDTSVTHDFFTPSTACIIQGKLGAVNATAFDMNAACAGFVFALDCANRYMATDPEMEYALVISNEMLSKITDYEDRTTCVLFGDGAAAVVLKRSDNFFTSFTHTNGEGAKHLFAKNNMPKTRFQTETKPEYSDGFSDEINKSSLVQNGRRVYAFATKALPEAVEKAAAKVNFDKNEIDYIIPHQANMRIIEAASERLDISLDKFLVNIAEHGNTSSASIPICFDESVRAGKIKRGDKVCFVGFGAGLTYGSVIVEY